MTLTFIGIVLSHKLKSSLPTVGSLLLVQLHDVGRHQSCHIRWKAEAHLIAVGPHIGSGQISVGAQQTLCDILLGTERGTCFYRVCVTSCAPRGTNEVVGTNNRMKDKKRR